MRRLDGKGACHELMMQGLEALLGSSGWCFMSVAPSFKMPRLMKLPMGSMPQLISLKVSQ